MLGIEKRVRSLYGEDVGENRILTFSFGNLLIVVALALSVIALLMSLNLYSAQGTDTSALEKSVAAAQANLTALQAKVGALEGKAASAQDMVVNAMISDVAQSAGYLARQPLTEEQKKALREALAPLVQ